jgi:hypothetical protein
VKRRLGTPGHKCHAFHHLAATNSLTGRLIPRHRLGMIIAVSSLDAMGAKSRRTAKKLINLDLCARHALAVPVSLSLLIQTYPMEQMGHDLYL